MEVVTLFTKTDKIAGDEVIDFKIMASLIQKHVGGKENVELVEHCATRIRLPIKNDALVDMKALEDSSGILRVIRNDYLEIAIGREVPRVYRELVKLGFTTKIQDRIV